MAFTEHQSTVVEYYIAALGRIPDASGLEHWVGRLEGTVEGQTHLTELEILDQFFNRDIEEVALRFPSNQTDEELVMSIYENVFGREADEGGLAYWAGRLSLNENQIGDILTENELLAEMLNIAQATGNEIDGEYLQNKLKEAQIEYDLVNDTLSPSIESIEVLNGNYTPDSIVDIIIHFNEDVVIDNIDSELAVVIGDYTSYATYAYKTTDTITYKYTVEDGISDTEQIVGIRADALVLNNTTIVDTSNNEAIITNEAITNEDAIVNDNKAPSIIIDSAYYTSNTDKLIFNGSGFLSILEEGEDSTAEVIERFDFTKLVWDIDGDYNTSIELDEDTSISNVLFSNTDIRLIKVIDDTKISVVFSPEFTALETATNFGHGSVGTLLDTLDILEGFVLDKVGNVSTDSILNNVTVGIDNIFYGNTNNNNITGTTNDDIIFGSAGSNLLKGEYGNDTIIGSDSNDTIVGGLGIDILTGGLGADTFVFSTLNNDSVIAFTSLEGIDKIIDLSLNGLSSDKIDLDVQIENVNTSVSGTVNQNTFIENINSLVSIPLNGFNSITTNDISATMVYVNDGDLINKSYIIIDLDGNDHFTEDDFAIETTGVVVDSFNTEIFI